MKGAGNSLWMLEFMCIFTQDLMMCLGRAMRVFVLPPPPSVPLPSSPPLRTILFVYDFWHFPGRALNVHCTLRPPPSPKRKSHQQLARISAALWGFTTYFMMKFTPLYFTQWTSGNRKSPHKNCLLQKLSEILHIRWRFFFFLTKFQKWGF